MNTDTLDTPGTIVLSENSARTVVSLISNIVEMACEHEPDLGLMRLVNLMDLYRTYLEHVVVRHSLDDERIELGAEPAAQAVDQALTDCASFEQFVSDSRLLHMAAQAASRECGVTVATPAPLKQSANNIFN